MDDIRNRFISVLYNATRSVDTIRDIEIELDDILFNRAGAHEDEAQLTSLVDELQPHIENATTIQKRITGDRAINSSMAGLLEAIVSPALMFSDKGDIVSMNMLAAGRGWNNANRLEDLALESYVFKNIQAFVKSPQSDAVFVGAAFIDSASDEETLFCLRDMSHAMNAGQRKLFLLSIVDLDFDDRALLRFGEAYQLTLAEREIVGHIVRGHTPKEAADLRNTSEATVRTQIKTLKSKTRVNDLPALVRLFCGYLNSVVVPDYATRSEAEVIASLKTQKVGYFTLRDRRRLEVRFHGDPNGRPVLLFHNMPYGVEISQAAKEFCVRNHLLVIAPYRPGYGQSTALETRTDDAYLQEIADDYAELLGKLEIRQIVGLSLSVGSAFALHFAHRYPDLVRKLIAVSRVPIWRESWLQETPIRQRLMLKLVKDLPSMAILFGGAALGHLNEGKLNKFINECVSGSRPDELAIRDPEILELMRDDIFDGFKNGMETFVRECRITLLDMTETARQTLHKFHILHGDEDKIIPLHQSQTFADEVPGSRLEVVAGAGQLMSYSHWQTCMTAALQAWSVNAEIL